MAFDMTTAKVIEEPKKKFDITTTKVIEESKKKFDITTAKVIEEPNEKKSVVKSVVDGLEKVGSKVYDGVNRIIEPAVDAAKDIKSVVKTAADTTVAPITKVANASVPVNINYKEIEKQPKKAEPILRARTAYDDSPLTIGPATPIIRARTRQDDINEVAARIGADKQGLEHDPIIEAVVNPATMLGKGVITKGGLAIFEAIQQAKNAAISKYKGKDFDLLAYENLTSLLPENTPQALKIASGLGEMVGDAIVAGKLETSARNFLIKDTADRLKVKLQTKGYNENEINNVMGRFYSKIINKQEIKNLENKNLIGKQGEQKPVNIDEAISLNRQIRKAEFPQAEPKKEPLKADMDVNIETEPGSIEIGNEVNTKSNINENNFIEVAGNIADRYKNHSNLEITQEQVSKDFNYLAQIENIVKNKKANIEVTGKELLPTESENVSYDLNDVDMVRELAKTYYKNNLQKRGYYLTRPEIDGKIYFTGREKFFSANNKNIEALKLLPVIKEIIEKGKVLPFSNITPGVLQKANKNIIGYYFITDIVKQNGINKLVTISLEKDKFGNFFYNLNNGIIDTLKKKLENRFDPDLESGVQSPSKDSIAQNNRNDNSNKSGLGSYSSVLKTGVKIGANETVKETDFKLYQRTYDLAKKYMKNNIAESKYRPRNTLGVYYNYGSGKGNIFVKSLNTIDVVSHELVHAIDDELGISRNLLDSGNAVESELIRACKELYPIDMRKRGKEAQLLEGMASLVQHMVVNPEIAKRFPQAANFIRSNEKLNNFVQDARQIVVDYESQNNVQKVKSEIYDRPIKTVSGKKIPLSVKLDSQFFDSEAVLRWLDEDLYIAAKGYKTVLKGIIENNLTNNKGVMYILDSNGNPKKVSDIVNWKTFIQYAEKTGKEFNTFLVARRFFNWYKQRDKLVNLIEVDTNNLKSLVKKLQKTQLDIKNTGLQKELDAAVKLENKLKAEISRLQNRINVNSEKLHDLKDIIKNHGKDEATMKDVYATLNTEQNQKLATDYDFLIDCNLKTLKNAGLLTEQMYKEFSENEGYTPFNKVAYDEIAGDGGLDFVSKFAPNSVNVKNLKKMKGSDLPIVSPLYSSVHFMTEAYKKAYRQIVYNKLGEIADMYPEVMQKVQYVKGMEKDGSMIVARDDKGVRYGVKVDPFIKKVIDGVSNIIRPDWMSNMLLVPARFFTNMTTGLYPLYAPVNFLRDQVTAFVNSQTNYIPILSAIQTYLNPVYKKYIDEYDNLFGVDNNTLLGTLKDIDPSDLSRAFKEGWGKKFIRVGKKLFAFPSNFSETLTRRTEYAKARAKGYSVTEAKRMADEITAAFGDRGLWFGNVGQVLTKSIPYFNSALQVIRQAGRAVNSKNIWKFLTATGVIAGAMVATNKSILDSENEEEKRQHMQLMAEQLAMYIYVPNGKVDGMIRIPIDQTYSWLGVLMTMLYNQSKGYDYKVSDYVAGATAWLPDQINFFETLTNLLTEKDFSGLQKQIITSIPHLPRTVLSGLFGKRTFPHVMDIVPKRLQSLEPRLQYDNRTSFVAKFLGDKLNLSPMKIDYFIDQGLGRTIRLGTRTTEASYGLLTDDKSWNENLKQMNPFVQQDFFSSGRIVQDFYDIKDNVDRLYKSAHDGLRKLSADEMSTIKKYKGYTDSIGKTMGQYNKLVQYMRDNKDKMSESELKSNELKKKRVEKQLFDAIRKMKGWKVEEMSD